MHSLEVPLDSALSLETCLPSECFFVSSAGWPAMAFPGQGQHSHYGKPLDKTIVMCSTWSIEVGFKILASVEY